MKWFTFVILICIVCVFAEPMGRAPYGPYPPPFSDEVNEIDKRKGLKDGSRGEPNGGSESKNSENLGITDSLEEKSGNYEDSEIPENSKFTKNSDKSGKSGKSCDCDHSGKSGKSGNSGKSGKSGKSGNSRNSGNSDKSGKSANPASSSSYSFFRNTFDWPSFGNFHGYSSPGSIERSSEVGDPVDGFDFD